MPECKSPTSSTSSLRHGKPRNQGGAVNRQQDESNGGTEPSVVLHSFGDVHAEGASCEGGTQAQGEHGERLWSLGRGSMRKTTYGASLDASWLAACQEGRAKKGRPQVSDTKRY